MDILDHDIAEKEEQLKKYKLAINMGRWVVLAMLAYTMARFVIDVNQLPKGTFTKYWTLYDLCVVMASLILTLWSYKQPYIGMLLLSILFCGIAASSLFLTIYFAVVSECLTSVLSTALVMQSAMSIFVVTAAVHAKKYKKLKRSPTL